MSNIWESLSVADFEKICRTCLGRGKMKNLYEKCCKDNYNRDNYLLKMLLSVTFLQLSVNDGLPFQICSNCEEEITRAYKFAVKCSEVDMKLRNCITEFESKLPYNFHNKTNKSSTAETLKIENPELNTENVEMQIKTEIEIEENGDYTVPKIKSEELSQHENEQNNSVTQDILGKKSTQNEDDQDESIYNERINENEHTSSEKHDVINNKSTLNEDTHSFQDESGETEDRINENLPQNKNSVIDEKINDMNGISKLGKQIKKGRKPKVKNKIFVQQEIGETEEGKFHENLPKNNNSDEKINSKNGVTKPGKDTKKFRKTKTKQLQVDQTFQCKKCFEKFPTSKLLWVHHKAVQHPRDTRINCEICSESVRWQRMTAHMRIHNNEKPYCCKICSKQFSVSSYLNRHMKIHSEEKSYKCQYCNKSFNQSTGLKIHERIHTGEKPYKCQYCDKSFNQRTALTIHLRIHTDERPYMCENCGKGFRSGGLLKFHLLSHEDRTTEQKNKTSDEPNLLLHECDVCHRKYKTNGLLKKHMLLHGEKKYLCSECGRRFLSKAALDIHSIVHTGIKRYSCDTCGKKFSYLHILRQHTLIHTGEKPFVCKICNRGFTQAQALKHHLRTHTGEKPFSCNFCDKRFALNVNLRVHTRTHTGETPYLCPICGKGFYDSSSMKKHKQGHEKHKI